MSDGRVPVVEIFGPTIQGEGALCGQVSYFIRTGGCGFRCSWCDSMHAVDPKQVRRTERLTQEEIAIKFFDLPHDARKRPWVTLTGGDPVMWDLTELVQRLKLAGFRVAVETQAALWRDWLESCDLVTASPKGPSSGMEDKLDVSVLQKYQVRLGDRWALKVVVFGADDFDFAAKVHRKFPEVQFFLSSGTPSADGIDDTNAARSAILYNYRELIDRVLEDPRFHDATVLPQVHALVWGRELGR